MKDIFKPEDFKFISYDSRLDITAAAADIANRKLSELIATWPKVYAYTGPASRKGGMWIVEGSQDADSDHQAYLAFIEEIPKGECEHEPLNPRALAVPVVCKHCSRRLKANWELAEE